jgi:hypothetical protein
VEGAPPKRDGSSGPLQRGAHLDLATQQRGPHGRSVCRRDEEPSRIGCLAAPEVARAAGMCGGAARVPRGRAPWQRDEGPGRSGCTATRRGGVAVQVDGEGAARSKSMAR